MALGTAQQEVLRYTSFAHQVRVAKQLGVSSVLQIGVFSGEVTALLQNASISVSTLDVDALKRPDTVLDVRELSAYSAKRYPLVICSRILTLFSKRDVREVLYSLYNVTTKYVLISLPAKYFFVDVQVSSLLLEKLLGSSPACFSARIPFFFSHKPYQKYSWMLGTRGCSRKWFFELVTEAGFVVEEAFFSRSDVLEYFILLTKE
ncbi:MAG: hypothetical protein ACMXYD_05330 [Candidatus Woesearchaeota archaeon]